MRTAGVVRALLVAVAATFMFVGSAQALTIGGSAAPAGVPSQAEVDQAIADLKSGRKHVVELKAPQPSWFTPELQQKVHENGVAAAPVDAPFPGQVGIRPGSLMISPFICTMNYIFQKGDTIAIGTAGHCIDGNSPVTLLTVAPTGGNPVLVELGPVLYHQNAGVGKDFALVEVPPERRDWVFPTIAAIGGPCGIYSGGDPQPVAHYGHGLVGGFPGTPRVGMGFELTPDQEDQLNSIVEIQGVDWDWDEDSIVWAGYLYGGDSGSAVRIGQLPAVSNLTHGVGVTGLEPSVLGWGTRVTTVTNSGWTLVNSPLCL
jgi:hypothetical protein